MATPPVQLSGINEPIASTRVIVCEGGGDVAFFRALIAARNLPQFYVTCPIQNVDPGGREGMGSRLTSLRLQEGFAGVEGVLVVSDNDTNPNGSFVEVRRQILAAEKYHAPNHPYRVAHGSPSIAVMMIPAEGINGQLETMCLEAMQAQWPAQYRCAVEFGTCTGINTWTQAKQEKARLRALISHICNDPNTSLTYAWASGRQPPNLIPLGHTTFDGVADFLTRFDELIVTAAAVAG